MKIKPVILIVLKTVILTYVQSSEGGGGLLDGMLQPILKQFRKIGSPKNEKSGPDDTSIFMKCFGFCR